MNKSIMILSLVAGAIFASLASAQQKDAGWKIRGEYYGDSGATYQRHAYDHARVLQRYSSAGQPVPQAVAKEHAAAVRSNINSSQKAYGKLGESVKDDKEAGKHLAAIKEHQDKALAMCDTLDKECSKADGDHVKIGECCSTIADELKAAAAEEDHLKKHLGIGQHHAPKK